MSSTKLIIFILFFVICFCIIIDFVFLYKNKENFNSTYNLAFYTCFYGESNNPAYKIPELPSEKYDCYYFSNNSELLKQLNGTKWIPIYDNKPLTRDATESSMHSKHVKSCPEDFDVLKRYDYLCYLDSKLEKISETFIEKFADKVDWLFIFAYQILSDEFRKKLGIEHLQNY